MHLRRKNGKEIVIKDGKESQLYNYVYNLTYSPDGKSFAFEANIGDEETGKRLVVKNGKESKLYDGVSILGFPQNGTVSFEAMLNGKEIIVKM